MPASDLRQRVRLQLGRLRRRGKPPAGLNHWQFIGYLHERLRLEGPRGLRPNYSWPILHCTAVAKHLSVERVSVLEFGVAGGNGLVAMERAAIWAEEAIGVGIDVYGFDTGTGLPEPVDYRDTPFMHRTGDFPMDEQRLHARLERATLVLGRIRDTIGEFLARGPAPVGFISFDLDYYSSTLEAFPALEADTDRLMPRVLCYFDDVLGYPWGELNGERLAIRKFNATRQHRQISALSGLRYMLPASERKAAWPEAMYVAHVLDHPRYNADGGVAISTILDLEVR